MGFFERKRIRLLLIADAQRGLADIEAGRTLEADAAIAQIQQRRAASGQVQAGTAHSSADRVKDRRNEALDCAV